MSLFNYKGELLTSLPPVTYYRSILWVLFIPYIVYMSQTVSRTYFIRDFRTDNNNDDNNKSTTRYLWKEKPESLRYDTNRYRNIV